MNKLLRLLKLITVAACLGWSAIASTGHSNDVYQIAIPISEESDSAKKLALQEAFKVLLERHAISNELQEQTVFAKAFKRIDPYVQRFHYQRSADGLQVVFNFDKNELQTLLNEAEIPVKHGRRPSTLLWIASHKDDNYKKLNFDLQPELEAQLQQTIKTQALPVIIPMQDLSEAELLSAEQIYKFEPRALEKTLARYQAKAFLAVKYESYENSIVGECFFSINGRQSTWPISGANLNELLQAALLGLKQQYLGIDQSQSLKSSSKARKQEFKLAFNNLDNAEDFFKVQNIIKHLALVSKSNLVQADVNAKVFQITFKGEYLALKQILAEQDGVKLIHDDELAPIQFNLSLLP